MGVSGMAEMGGKRSVRYWEGRWRKRTTRFVVRIRLDRYPIRPRGDLLSQKDVDRPVRENLKAMTKIVVVVQGSLCIRLKDRSLMKQSQSARRRTCPRLRPALPA